ncbi:MAG: hypothetical protein LUC18_04705 [Porphyromonadaceae bacterium]|nr:hypothetical protein [Porphyromonadaceae bacterium]
MDKSKNLNFEVFELDNSLHLSYSSNDGKTSGSIVLDYSVVAFPLASKIVSSVIDAYYNEKNRASFVGSRAGVSAE